MLFETTGIIHAYHGNSLRYIAHLRYIRVYINIYTHMYTYISYTYIHIHAHKYTHI